MRDDQRSDASLPATVAAFLRGVFDAPVRTFVACLWFIGVGFATTAALLAVLRPSAGPFGAFLLPAGGLAVLGSALLATRVWAMAVSFVLLAGQIVGVVGTTLQLLYGIDPGKAAHLRAMGVEPTVGVAINFTFSLIATCALAVALWRAQRQALRRSS